MWIETLFTCHFAVIGTNQYIVIDAVQWEHHWTRLCEQLQDIALLVTFISMQSHVSFQAWILTTKSFEDYFQCWEFIYQAEQIFVYTNSFIDDLNIPCGLTTKD